MQRLFTHIMGVSVSRFGDGEVLGYIYSTIIDPERGQIKGFYVKTNEIFPRKKILLTKDIYKWKLKVYIQDESVLCDTDDIIRLKDLLSNGIYILNAKVYSLSNIYIGKVYDYNFDLLTFKIINLFIIKRFLFFNIQKRIVPKKEIIEILPNRIIIKSSLKLSKWRRKQIINLKNFVFTPTPENSIAMETSEK